MSKKNRLKRPRNWKSLSVAASVDSRQRRRAMNRALAFMLITKRFGGEPRDRHRAMALVLAKRKDFGHNARTQS